MHMLFAINLLSLQGAEKNKNKNKKQIKKKKIKEPSNNVILYIT